jgi:tRNA threonylcarbamoyladenosine biosynthesis protein TsaB
VRILAIDTATAVTTVAFEQVERRHDPDPGARPGHAERVLELAADALAAAGARWADAERIAVGVGPGGFTGLRIGIATAQGLARGLGVPLIGVSTLAALALGAEDPDALAVIDARRGEVFALGPGLPEAVLSPEQLAGAVKPGQLVVGDGALRYRQVLEAGRARVPSDADPRHRVNARQHQILAAELEPDGAVEPTYLRAADAKRKAER